jgi:DNA-binding MarR family transcriptional regulator
MKTTTRDDLLAQCACFDLRKTTRAISRMYDDFLRDAGLTNAQYSLLVLIRDEKELSVSTLSHYMVMDRTSITRALAPLQRDGLLSIRLGTDKRLRVVALTKKGHKLVEKAEPKWLRAQKVLMEVIGANRWSTMRTLIQDIRRKVRHRTIDAPMDTP